MTAILNDGREASGQMGMSKVKAIPADEVDQHRLAAGKQEEPLVSSVSAQPQ